MAVMWNLFRTAATDDTNISNHLNLMKTMWDCLNMASDKHVQLSDIVFKSIITQSLPEVWDAFTHPYIEEDTKLDDPTKAMMSSQRFMGLINEEYNHCISCTKMTESINLARVDKSCLAKRLNALHGPKDQNSERCRQCGMKNHATNECRFIRQKSQNKCPMCDRFGHNPENCWFKDCHTPQREKGGSKRISPLKRLKKVRTLTL